LFVFNLKVIFQAEALQHRYVQKSGSEENFSHPGGEDAPTTTSTSQPPSPCCHSHHRQVTFPKEQINTEGYTSSGIHIHPTPQATIPSYTSCTRPHGAANPSNQSQHHPRNFFTSHHQPRPRFPAPLQYTPRYQCACLT
jgi:hypothetical protein